MKSVMFSEIVHAHRGAGGLRALRGLPPLAAYGLTLAIGMPLLVLALRALDPGAPLALIVLPMLAGLALPLWTGTPGRLDISTRFDAVHMRHTLDAALTALGYVQADARPGQLRYVRNAVTAWRTRRHVVNIRIHAHALEVIGPIPTLRALHRTLSGATSVPVEAPATPAPRTELPSRETVAGAMQISDNAERVAGMAE
ncbi:hypothetical protein [Massilia niabensis]|uniref:PH domain-containing protein n=1 Tax=Massilia niabensis TaxID=544910 RepID=A0ABW0L5H5_9BURK